MNLKRKSGYIGLALLFLISIFAVDVLNLVSPALAVSYGVLTKFPSNPVVTSGAAADSGATVIYDGGTYKMWYVETSITDTMRLDLYNHLSATLKGHLNAGNFTAVAASDGADIKTFLDYLKNTVDLNGYINSITTTMKYATSPSSSGTVWTDGGAVTFPTTAWNKFISSPNVIYDNSASKYKMWYTGFNISATDLQSLIAAIDPATLTAATIQTLLHDIFTGSVTQLHSDIISVSLQSEVQGALNQTLTFLGNNKPAIGYADSTNGTSWNVNASALTMTGGWDNIGVMTPAVVKNADGSYDMWYTGISISLTLANLKTATNVTSFESDLVNGVNMAIGHAHAASGTGDSGWAKDISPVLQKGSLSDWDNYGVFAPAVIKNADGTYDMWYTGVKGNLSTFSTYLSSPSHNLDTTVFTGASTAIGHATLANSSAIATPDSTAVLNKGANGDWDNFGVAFPSVVLNGGNLNMWYTGIKVSPGAAVTSFFSGNNPITTVLTAGGGTNAKIGFASATIPTTTTTTTPPPSGGGGGGGGGGFGPPPAGYVNFVNHISPSGIVADNLTGTSSDGLLTLTIPKGTIALTGDGRALNQISIFPANPQPAAATGFKIFGIFYEMQPSGATFNPAITISFSYSGLTLPAGVNESDITAGWIDAQGKFNTLTSTVDTVNKIVTAPISHFTMFGLEVPTGPVVTTTTPAVPATFTTTKFAISPSQAQINQAIAVSVLVTNTGSASSTFSIDLKIDNTVTDTKKITLAGGASDTVTFNVTKATAGTYTISIGGDSGKLVVSDVPVVSTPTVKPAAFSTADLSITPKSMKPGGTATVSVSVTNTGSLQGTYTVVLKINGATEDSRDVILAGGDTKSVNFTITKSQPGAYAISVDSLSASLEVQASAISSPATGTPTSSKNNTPIVVGAIIGAILGLFLALLLVQYMIRPATFSMSGLSIMPPLVTPGATAHVNVKVSNTGSKHGTYKVTMKINGVIEGSQDVTLQKGTNQVVGFTVVKNNPGIYMITIDNVSGRLVVQDQSGEELPQTDKAKTRNWPGLFH